MSIKANVVDGVLDYTYTDSSSDATTTSGSDLGYDQFLQLLCAEMQYQDPLEPTSNTDYVAQLATFSQLEATMSMETTTENQFASGLVGQQVILAVEDSNTGKTSYVSGQVDYVMYQDGEAYLSVNNSLYPASDLDTVASSSYYEASVMSETFDKMLAQLPGVSDLTLTYKGAVSDLRDYYDGLTDYQKEFVNSDSYKSFQKIEERMNELVKAKEASSTTTE